MNHNYQIFLKKLPLFFVIFQLVSQKNARFEDILTVIFLRCKLPGFSFMNLPIGLIETELKIFESRFKEAVKSQTTPVLDRIMRYIVKRKGKQLRPMFVLLSAKLCGEINEPPTGPLPL